MKELLDKAETLIAEGNAAEAQVILDQIEGKDARWHFLQSRIFSLKKWQNESRKQLEIAIKLDPENQLYKEELENIKEVSKQKPVKEKKGAGKFEGFGEACCLSCCDLCCGIGGSPF